MNKQIVKDIALRNGFKLKQQTNGELELNPYVYDFADELVKVQQQELKSLKAQLAQYQSDDYVLVPKKNIEFFWQDDKEPENFCSSACGDDIECLGHNLDLGEIMAINKTHEVILKTEELFGTWYAEVSHPHLKANFHIGTHEECLAIVAKNIAMTEAQEQNNG